MTGRNRVRSMGLWLVLLVCGQVATGTQLINTGFN